MKLDHIHCQKYTIQWLTCNDAISEIRVVIKCHSLAYISDNSALKSSQVTDRKLLVNDPIKHGRRRSIFKMTSSSLRIKPPHNPKGYILVLMRTPLKINTSTNYNELEGDFAFIVVKLYYNENIARKYHLKIAGYKVKRRLEGTFFSPYCLPVRYKKIFVTQDCCSLWYSMPVFMKTGTGKLNEFLIKGFSLSLENVKFTFVSPSHEDAFSKRVDWVCICILPLTPNQNILNIHFDE